MQHRSDIFVCSKLWNEHHNPNDVEAALQNSLTNLGLEYLDLFIMHWPFAFKREHPHTFPPVLPKLKVNILFQIKKQKGVLELKK